MIIFRGFTLMILMIKHVANEGPGLIAKFFENSPYRVKTIELYNGDKLPESVAGIEAIIVLGGPMNVYEEEKHPFLKSEMHFLKDAIKMQIPLLGICLGAQLLARAGGAEIKKAQARELGWYKISITEKAREDTLFKGLNSEIEVFQWHEDSFSVPKDGTLLASSKVCNQAFRIGNLYGLQFHFEVIPEMVENWIDSYDGDISRIDKKTMATYAHRNKSEFEKNAFRILSNFRCLLDQKAA
ncbi:MAG: type 1 glutamine amidotransferase [Candidatus Omnitrophica bacterium]|nr:type 1 glutamine amidotransferase [Candidatus Omnitrophota bacterium]